MDQSIRLSGGRLGFLLIHGLGGTPLEMRYVAQGLYHAGHTVHVPQLAGHCGSSDDLKATRWADWYATVDREHDRLKTRCSTMPPCDQMRSPRWLFTRPPSGSTAGGCLGMPPFSSS